MKKSIIITLCIVSAIFATIFIVFLWILLLSNESKVETYRGQKAYIIFAKQSKIDAIEYNREDSTDRFITIDSHNRIKYEYFVPSRNSEFSKNTNKQNYLENITVKITKNIDVDVELYECMKLNAIDWRSLKK